ncbi:tRNA pseudouridine(38-40) synthase TruA [Candidatus Symbiobacter mobilis]|uniref:tRNA pseudouridine synthase A n=1 Tax=Candidatus Symbiobacter mobilis CR TaxID=946483 RepID=U5NAD8_9BURK|nr:tRNA pseudouridine(38-40) synthase TruA [Candidatus Symbiobacter mobilis]AGX88516.1 tRNA pseudouridine synthase A [Candidatus Symbiobacter mobilis CR]
MRVVLGLGYCGSNYQGWQSQPSQRTVQDALEHALSQFCACPSHAVRTVCAGRTDAGVHALLQVVHFDTSLERQPFSWVRGCNALLPKDIAILWARVVPQTFHCRSCALSRRYVYVLRNAPVRPSVDTGRVGWVFRPLDADRMREAASYLLGEHDFSSFRASACQARSPVKRMLRIAIERQGNHVRCDFEADAFLHHMIRNIMGCLVAIGSGQRPPAWMLDVLQARNRTIAAPTFAPDGLYFLGPRYDPAWGLPDDSSMLDGLPGCTPTP